MRDRFFRKILTATEYLDPKPVRWLEVRVLKSLARRSFGRPRAEGRLAANGRLAVTGRSGANGKAIVKGLRAGSRGASRDGGALLRASRNGGALAGYAEFTTACMEAWGDDPALADRLYRDAYRLGSMIRKVTGFAHCNDLDRLIFCLYRNIDISMSGSTDGELIVSDCYFSNYYTPEQCKIMSNVDSGIVAGICGGGRLEFTERITEGCGRCRACLIGDPAIDQAETSIR